MSGVVAGTLNAKRGGRHQDFHTVVMKALITLSLVERSLSWEGGRHQDCRTLESGKQAGSREVQA